LNKPPLDHFKRFGRESFAVAVDEEKAVEPKAVIKN
jgi:hypothetical protein